MEDLLVKRVSEQLVIDPRRRYRRLFLGSMFASPVFIGWMLVTVIAEGILLFIGLLGAMPISFALLVAVGSLVALNMWLFAYAALYIPTRPTPHTVPDVLRSGAVSHNLADAANYSLLVLLGKSFGTGRPDEIGIFVERLLKTKPVQEFLRRIQVEDSEFLELFHTTIAPEISWESLASIVGAYMGGAGRMHIEAVDIVSALLLQPSGRVWLRKKGLQESDVQFMAWWLHQTVDGRRQRSRWWSSEYIVGFTGIGLSWAAGFTPFVDRFARTPRGSAWDVAGFHTKALDSLVGTLARARQANVLLVGQPGVGRIGIVKELMQKVASNTAHPALGNQRVLYMHISELASLGSTGQEQMAVVSRALREMERAGNIIVVLDGLGSVLGDNASIDSTEILVPFLSSATVRVVAVLSTEDHQRIVAGNQELEKVFEVVNVDPLSEEKTMQLLALGAGQIEEKTGVFIPYLALKEVVSSTVSILPHIPFPEKVFDILEELIVEAQGKRQHIITASDVDDLISRKVGVNVGQLKAEESVRLASLEDLVHRRVVNQKEGVRAVSRAMVRARAGVRSQNKPIGSFLFLGPTGVGKTETAKALAETYFGSTRYLQRLDMSEFQTDDSIGQLIGTVDKPVGRLLATVSAHPFSVLLLDEFEKASPSIQQLFMPLLDEGYLTDAQGRTYSFVHTIIIATSNAGSELIRTSVSEDGTLPEGFSEQLREHILSKNIFLPELLNRFDGAITFTPLTVEHMKQVAHLMMVGLNKRLDAKHGVRVQVTDDLISFLVEHGYDPQFGARPMRRLIQDTVEYEAARQILANTIEPGQQLTIPAQSLKALL